MAKGSDPALAEARLVWEPQPRQAAFITCPADEVGFGGARGGGKSDAVLGDWLSHEEQYGSNAVGVVMRRERTQLIELPGLCEEIQLLGAWIAFSHEIVSHQHA